MGGMLCDRCIPFWHHWRFRRLSLLFCVDIIFKNGITVFCSPFLDGLTGIIDALFFEKGRAAMRVLLRRYYAADFEGGAVLTHTLWDIL